VDFDFPLNFNSEFVMFDMNLIKEKVWMHCSDYFDVELN